MIDSISELCRCGFADLLKWFSEKERRICQMGMAQASLFEAGVVSCCEGEGESGKELARRAGKAKIEYVNRTQEFFYVTVIDKIVGCDHEVRAIWEFVTDLDLSGFEDEIRSEEGSAGRRALEPAMLISLWVYAYSKGVSAAREIGRLCVESPAYQWLCGCRPVSYHTLSSFRVKHNKALTELFAQILGVMSAEGLVTLERVMHDGTKVKAYASGDRFRREKTLDTHLEQAQEQVRAMVEQGEKGEAVGARVDRRRQRRAQERVGRLESAKRQLKKLQQAKPASEREDVRVNESDPDCRIMKQGDGAYAPSYNVQISTDADNAVIVGVGVTQQCSDHGELEPSVERIEQQSGKAPEQMVVDGGFMSRETILSMDERGVDLVGPMGDGDEQGVGQLKRRGIAAEFFPSAFTYDMARDVFLCPAGAQMKLDGKEKRIGVTKFVYRCDIRVCGDCCFRDKCCPGNEAKGRSVSRSVEHPVVAAHREKMQTEQAKAVYKQRGGVAEFTNAWLKTKNGLRQFRLRGLAKVSLEVLWASMTYNIQQWIRLRWRPRLSSA